MKEKIINTIKKAQQNPTTISTSIISLMFLIFILLSMQRNGLFLKEIILCASIICLVLLNTDK